MKFLITVLLVSLLLGACQQQNHFAPVVTSRYLSYSKYQATHTVIRGETLYAIAFRYDRDYRHLAAINHLKSPYALSVGQVIQLGGGNSQSYQRLPIRYLKQRSRKRLSVQKKPYSREYRASFQHKQSGHFVSKWIWPARGRVVANYMPSHGRKGVDIAGKKGDSVRASAAGTVAYSGSGLPGYGNLIIIKHPNNFLTAYSNNLKNHVKEGQSVRAGQVIAEMGMVNHRFYGVHYEIRQAGKPLNPIIYLR